MELFIIVIVVAVIGFGSIAAIIAHRWEIKQKKIIFDNKRIK